MSHFKKSILKVALVMSVITGSVLWAQSQGLDAQSTVQNIETKSEAVATMVGEKVEPARKALDRFDVGAKVQDIQHKTRPIGQKIDAAVSIDSVPGAKAAIWAERHMSLPALLLMLVFGGIVAIMGMSGPNSHLGGRH